MSGVLQVPNFGPLIFPNFINNIHAPVRISNGLLPQEPTEHQDFCSLTTTLFGNGAWIPA